MRMVLDRAETAAPPEARRGRLLAGRAFALLPWLLVLAALLTAWADADVPGGDIARFAAYWTLCLVLPGTLVHRALRGGRGNLPEDLGYGAATGLLLELVAWAAAAATGQQHLLRWWPVPVVIAFVVVPGLRRHWRGGPRRPLPVAWHWAFCVVLLLALAWAMAEWRRSPLPPATYAYYQDLFYHLGLVQELTRSMPFRLPHVYGEALRYHYLSDAHVASGSMITGISPAMVMLRLWIVPVVATAMLVAAGLARDLARTAWVGPVVAAAGFLGGPVTLGSPISATGYQSLSFASLSQVYVLAPLLLLAGICVDAVRGRGPGRAWPLVPALGLACAGGKSSALPPLIVALGLAAVVAWWRRRSTPWAVLGALVCLLVAMGLGYLLFAGGGAGSLKVQAFGLLRFMAPYTETMGVDDGVQPGGGLPPGLADAGADGLYFAFALLGWWLLAQASRFAGWPLLISREHRGDPAGWLLAGAVLAGAAATWVFHHPAASQVYFWLGVIPFGALLSGWWLAAVRPPWPAVGVAGLFGVAAPLVVAPLVRPEPDTADWLRTVGDSVARFAMFALLAALLAVLVTVLARWRSGAGRSTDGPAGTPTRWWAVAAAGVTAALLCASVTVGVKGTVQQLERPPAPYFPERFAVTEDELRAALWLDAQADDEDVVATNVHCMPVATAPRCIARAFWVTGLGGHRALVESWGYTDAALAAQGRDGFGYSQQGPPDPALLAFNDGVFAAPTRADLDRMAREYGVRWLFADTRASAVSPELARLARVRLVSGTVTVYEVNRS
ncbi:hypothetical protein [Micromonospora sp. DT47]|uniref:hypothetical protein n=1 Tax=Micromonospora sp. DT47 TaxID=3393431 RepID=UPI003CF0A806